MAGSILSLYGAQERNKNISIAVWIWRGRVRVRVIKGGTWKTPKPFFSRTLQRIELRSFSLCSSQILDSNVGAKGPATLRLC